MYKNSQYATYLTWACVQKDCMKKIFHCSVIALPPSLRDIILHKGKYNFLKRKMGIIHSDNLWQCAYHQYLHLALIKYSKQNLKMKIKFLCFPPNLYSSQIYYNRGKGCFHCCWMGHTNQSSNIKPITLSGFVRLHIYERVCGMDGYNTNMGEIRMLYGTKCFMDQF